MEYIDWTSTSLTVVSLRLHVSIIFGRVFGRGRSVTFPLGSFRLLKFFGEMRPFCDVFFFVWHWCTGGWVQSFPVYLLGLKVGVLRHYSVGCGRSPTTIVSYSLSVNSDSKDGRLLLIGERGTTVTFGTPTDLKLGVTRHYSTGRVGGTLLPSPPDHLLVL